MFENLEPVSITARAAAEIRKIIDTKRIPPDYGLRVGIRGGGCGAELIIGFDTKKDTDLAYTIATIPVYVDKRHIMYLVGKEVDFYEGADARGFLFRDGESGGAGSGEREDGRGKQGDGSGKQEAGRGK